MGLGGMKELKWLHGWGRGGREGNGPCHSKLMVCGDGLQGPAVSPVPGTEVLIH